MTPSSAFLSESRVWVFSVLTLDIVRPFYGMMGLDAADPALLQVALRDATLVTRKRLSDALASNATPPTLEDFYLSVATTLGPTGVERFEWWLEKVMHADTHDNRGLWRWMNVLRWARHERARWQRLGFPKECSNEALQRFLQAIDKTEFERRIKELESQPLSDWDLHMSASQLFHFDDDWEAHGARPFHFVEVTIDDYQGYLFWAWVLRNLSSDQLEQLCRSSLRFVEDEDRMAPADLPHPATLNIGL